MKKREFGGRKIVFLAVCLCLMLTALIALFIDKGYVQSIQNLVRSTTKSSISELTVSKAQYLDEKMHSELLSLQSLASSIGINGPESFDQTLVEEYAGLHGVTNLWITDLSGNRWSVRHANEGGGFPEDESLSGAALRGETCISDTFIGAQGRRQVLFQTPLYEDGRVAGGLYVAHSVEMLQNTYGGTTYNDAGYSYVLDADGSIVLSPVRFSSLQLYSQFRQVLELGGNSPESISAFMDALQSGARGSATFNMEGEEQFLSFVPLEEKPGWNFVTVIPLSMVEKDGTEIISLAVRMAVVVIAAILVTLALAVLMLYLGTKRRRESELYIQNIYQAISQNIDTVIFIVDGKTAQVEYVFENAQEVLGIPAGDFSSPDGKAAGEFQQALQAWMREERPTEKTVWERRFFNDRLGAYAWLKLTALPVTLRGEAKYIFAATDITQDRKVREDLNAAVAAAEQANAAKSRFLSNMSHDIRTPMNAVIGMSKLAEIHIEDRAKVKDCLRKIEVSSKHLLNLINDVLDMSKIESGKMTLSAEPFSLPELIEGDLAIVQPQCRSKEQTFTVETKNIRHELLEGDPLRLNQVFLNLTSNAVKFTPEHGSITFTIEELPQRHMEYALFRFQVADTGIGIAPEFLPKLFTPFTRESTRTVNHTEGTGLGLPIAKNIVEAMGGQLLVESAEGKGTTFTVELEFKLPPGAEDELDGASVLKGLRVLLADGNPTELELLETYLTSFGMAVDAVHSGEEAVRAAGKASYALVVADWRLSATDGMEAARRIWAGGAETRVMLVTDGDGYMEMDTADKPPDAILQKPIFKSVLCGNLVKIFTDKAGEPADSSSQDVLSGRRFLLAEDNELNREIVVQLFELSGALVETAEDGRGGAEAFEVSDPGHFDAIFMDIQMPVMNGYEATRRIRASGHPQARSIPIVAMSANVFAEDVRASLAAGMSAHTGKPIDMDDICRILKELLPGHRNA